MRDKLGTPMCTLEQAAEQIAHVVLAITGLAHGPFYCATSLETVRDAYIRAMIRAFEAGEIRLHSATSMLPLSPQDGAAVVTSLLLGRIRIAEVNRWLNEIKVPIIIGGASRASEQQAAVAAPDQDLPWHRDPFWRKKIFDCADRVAAEHVNQEWGGTSPRDVMERVATLMRQEEGFPQVSAETIRRNVLNSQKGLPGWTITYRAETARDIDTDD